jgi:hypothetical protein
MLKKYVGSASTAALFLMILAAILEGALGTTCLAGTYLSGSNCLEATAGKWLAVIKPVDNHSLQGRYATGTSSITCSSAVFNGAAICQSTKGTVYFTDRLLTYVR